VAGTARGPLHGDGQAEHDDREGNAELHERYRHAGDAEHTTDRHQRYESERHRPDRSPTKVGREDADRDHREDVVNPVDGCERP
jgi:hypothetical protein